MSENEDATGKGNARGPGASVDVDAATRIVEDPASDAEDAETGAEDAQSGVEDDAPDEKTSPPPAQTRVMPPTEALAGPGGADPLAETRIDVPTLAGGERAGEPGEADPVDVDAATRVANRSYAKPPQPPAGPAPETSGILPGSVLFGEYEIIEVLGAGGMGEVYKARHRRLGEYRAIKMMHASLSGKKGANEFFLREAKALLAVRHPAVVHCHDLLSDSEGHVFLIMEMIEGESLADRMEDGPLAPDEVVLLGARLSAGLAAAHARGVVHRDLSPDNVVLPDGDVAQAKLIDFGIAKILEEGQGTIVDGFKGKLSYASPEQLGFFGGKIDGRSDFYSLGLVLCAASLGRPLGMGKTVVEAVDARRQFQRVPDDIPVGLRASIEPLLALDPKDRPEFAERLFVAPGQVMPDFGSGRTASAPARREGNGSWIAGLVAACALAAGVAAFVLIGEDPAPPAATGIPAPPTRTLARPADRATPPVERVTEAPAPPTSKKPARPPVHVLTPLDKMKIVGLLRGAEAALQDNRLQSPKGDNAYEKYRAVLELDPNNEDARLGLVEVTSRYIALGRSALASGDLDQATQYVSRAAAITPHHPDLPAARAAIASAAGGK